MPAPICETERRVCGKKHEIEHAAMQALFDQIFEQY
jgi:hypothetical protein